MASRREVLQLYRQILRKAQRFPSVGRDRLVQSIKDEFHENKNEADPTRLKNQLATARDGLDKLNMYESMTSGNASDWKLDLK
ncbi:Complex 1 LYR protein domain-containing protein [Plasmodiophora brassicae]|uniref:Complex 1 LYR protein domain-containing protein n=1 Tax=Plasmodiophora brassicae TaxID=37360 RepID=A0A0G4IKL5_PLABS|nr:hypothetical protein PBRA_004436 [Plasmodiophora brassicae]SPQ99975.1 unnamed protein product [Plasmodiophora brassicae]